jgi:hypothetical protein
MDGLLSECRSVVVNISSDKLQDLVVFARFALLGLTERVLMACDWMIMTSALPEEMGFGFRTKSQLSISMEH